MRVFAQRAQGDQVCFALPFEKGFKIADLALRDVFTDSCAGTRTNSPIPARFTVFDDWRARTKDLGALGIWVLGRGHQLFEEWAVHVGRDFARGSQP